MTIKSDLNKNRKVMKKLLIILIAASPTLTMVEKFHQETCLATTAWLLKQDPVDPKAVSSLLTLSPLGMDIGAKGYGTTNDPFVIQTAKNTYAAELPVASGIGIYSNNPFYWQYNGKPVLLLGGSSAPQDLLNDEGMFLWTNVTEALDKLVMAGGNYTRCLMSGRLREEALWPFMRKGDRYDLDQWNDEYWHLFEIFLEETHKRGITTDIEIWATFDYARVPWTKNPFNPVNNINYTAEQTGLPATVDSHPVQSKNEFYHILPGEKNIQLVLRYQKLFVDKILSYTLKYNNVLYCMDNETAGSPQWGAYWARYVREAATKANKKVLVTEMFDSHDLSNPVYKNIIRVP